MMKKILYPLLLVLIVCTACTDDSTAEPPPIEMPPEVMPPEGEPAEIDPVVPQQTPIPATVLPADQPVQSDTDTSISTSEPVQIEPLPTVVNADQPRGTLTTPDSGQSGGEEIVRSLAIINSLDILLMESFPVQASLQIAGDWPDGCNAQTRFTQATLDPYTIQVTVYTERSSAMMCPMVLVSFEDSIPLDILDLPAGTYTVLVNAKNTTFTLDVDNVAP